MKTVNFIWMLQTKNGIMHYTDRSVSYISTYLINYLYRSSCNVFNVCFVLATTYNTLRIIFCCDWIIIYLYARNNDKSLIIIYWLPFWPLGVHGSLAMTQFDPRAFCIVFKERWLRVLYCISYRLLTLDSSEQCPQNIVSLISHRVFFVELHKTAHLSKQNLPRY